MTQNLQPRNVWQPEIKKDEVRGRLCHARQSFGAGAHDCDFLPPRREDRLGEFPDEGVIVDDQDLVRSLQLLTRHLFVRLGRDHAVNRIDQGFAGERLFQPGRTEIFSFETAVTRRPCRQHEDRRLGDVWIRPNLLERIRA